MTAHPLAWLECRAPDCKARTAVDPRHVDNLTATGGWQCHAHNHAERSNSQ